MNAAPSAAIDLPLKVLVWEDDNGQVWLGYNSLEYLQNCHGISDEPIPNMAGVEILLQTALGSDGDGS